MDWEWKRRCGAEEARFKRLLARCSKCRGMRRWRPLSSSRSRNVISSPQATRVAFVSPFRIPLSWGDTGTGIKLQWKSTHSALHRCRPLLFSASLFCTLPAPGEASKQDIALYTLLVSRFRFTVLPSTSLAFSPLSSYLTRTTAFPYRRKNEESCSLSANRRIHPVRSDDFLLFNYLTRFKFVIIASDEN